MIFNNDDMCIGFENEPIHTFNKGESVLHPKHLSKLEGRSNAILMGDHIGDSRMSDGIQHDVVLRIGFLNVNVEDRMAEYQDKFDIVLTGDPEMDIVIAIFDMLEADD
jgi:hypothetical protein